MPRIKLVDPKCYELAEWWLDGAKPDTITSLAHAIQGAIEDWCDDEMLKAQERLEKDEEMRSLMGYDPDAIARKF